MFSTKNTKFSRLSLDQRSEKFFLHVVGQPTVRGKELNLLLLRLMT